MKIAIYPGTFNPWHQGHEDILKKALQCFDKVIIGIGVNPEKDLTLEVEARARKLDIYLGNEGISPVLVESFEGLLVDFVKRHQKLDDHERNENTCAVIRGLRNGHDLQYEVNQLRWNEDLGLEIPTVYFICDRQLSHISSSAIRAIKTVKDDQDY